MAGLVRPIRIAEAWPYYLAGVPVDLAAAGAVRDVLDKHTGEVVARVAKADAAAVEQAIRAAHAARARTRAHPAHARAEALSRCAAHLAARADALAALIVVEVGKPIGAARTEVARAIDTFRIAAEEATRIGGDLLPLARGAASAGWRGLTQRVPVGVCALVTPFNFPLNLVAHKVAPAIAAGCPFVLKPSERAPLSALAIGEALATCALPPGSWSILTADPAEANALVEDERVALLSFTGGEVGWALRARAGRKRVALELGGDASVIVDREPGAPWDHVVERIVAGAFGASGQTCISVQHIRVHADVYDDVRARLVARVADLAHGDPAADATVVGPMIDDAAARRLGGWIAEAVAVGARLLCGGQVSGAHLRAALLEDVPPACALHHREAFGPVAVLHRFHTWPEALAQVNASAYGLQAGVFTADLAHALAAWDALEVGGVVVGDVPTVRSDAMPYGGIKASGVGREGVRAAIAEMTDERLLLLTR